MPTLNSQDLELEKYFTDVEVLRDWFDKAIVAETLPKRLLVIHGVGGIGKSSLLRMFRLNCKTAHVPVALASGDEAKSAVDVLTRWGEDLKADGVKLPTFFKTYEHYRAIQAKVEDETSKAQKKLGDIAGKATSKTAEAAGGAALGAALGSVIPGIGTTAGAALGGVVGGMGAEALVDYLRGFLSKPDIDLLLDPSKKLTDDFLADVNQAASARRVVLMLDTYEQMTALDDWTREVAQQLNENILLVIAGRAMVNWGRQWSSWLMHAEVQELKPMPKRVMHELIRKYYATMRGGEPDAKQVNAIIEFSGGLPMVVNTAVQLWVKYGVEDFGAVKGEVVREVVARLREGVPTELYPLLETAAAMRYFNKEILRAVSGMGDINAGYEELIRFPFVRRRADGYALHDRVRDMIEENVRTDDPTKYRTVHERAVAYFEARMANASSEEAERLGLERLYHRVRADEEAGIKLFQEMAEELVRYRLLNRLRSLLNDVNTYSLEMENSRLWRKYYQARFLDILDSRVDAEKTYEAISNDPIAETKLRAYSLHDLGNTLRGRRIGKSEILDRALSCFHKSLDTNTLDSKLVVGYHELMGIYRDKGNWERAFGYIMQAVEYYKKNNDAYGLSDAFGRLRWFYLYRGDWYHMLETQSKSVEISEKLGNPPSLRIEISLSPAAIWCGRFAEIELSIEEAEKIRGELGLSLYTGNIAFVTGIVGKFEKSFPYFEKNQEKMQLGIGYSPRGAAVGLGWFGIILIRKGEIVKGLGLLNESVEIKKSIEDTSYLLETINWLGIGQEILGNFAEAEIFYRENLEGYRWAGRLYFDCGALTGLVRVKHAQGDYAAIPPLLAEAEQLAQQYEYNDHLASLRLTQGHIAWETSPPSPLLVGEGRGGEVGALHYYKHALIYALRYNRFLLDEVLSGRPQGTPLRPIIPECLKRGEEGRKMLLALREWWQTGTNDVGTPRPDTISAIPENIALLDAEKIAREREPGDGTKQKSVVEQIEGAL